MRLAADSSRVAERGKGSRGPSACFTLSLSLGRSLDFALACAPRLPAVLLPSVPFCISSTVIPVAPSPALSSELAPANARSLLSWRPSLAAARPLRPPPSPPLCPSPSRLLSL
eukprot:6177196-Pleurochrysis_carterae.AAC.2